MLDCRCVPLVPACFVPFFKIFIYFFETRFYIAEADLELLILCPVFWVADCKCAVLPSFLPLAPERCSGQCWQSGLGGLAFICGSSPAGALGRGVRCDYRERWKPSSLVLCIHTFLVAVTEYPTKAPWGKRGALLGSQFEGVAHWGGGSAQQQVCTWEMEREKCWFPSGILLLPFLFSLGL